MESPEDRQSHGVSAGSDEHPEIAANNSIDFSSNEYWNYCDNCGTRLQTFRCRYICPRCGFFHSCSEP